MHLRSLKEEKRLTSKIESLSRKVQSLQSKLATRSSAPAAPIPASVSVPQSSQSKQATRSSVPAPISTSVSVPSFTEIRAKTPTPPVPQLPTVGCSTRPTRIPSSPGSALRSKTPEPVRRSQIFNPPPVPSMPSMSGALSPRTPERANSVVPRSFSQLYLQHATPAADSAAVSTPQSSNSRKRRLPDDFATSERATVQAMIEPGVKVTPRQLRRRPSDLKSGFTPTRPSPGVALKHSITQPSPLRRAAVPLGESTNSLRESLNPAFVQPLGLDESLNPPAPAPAKPTVRSWLSRTRVPSSLGESRRL